MHTIFGMTKKEIQEELTRRLKLAQIRLRAEQNDTGFTSPTAFDPLLSSPVYAVNKVPDKDGKLDEVKWVQPTTEDIPNRDVWTSVRTARTRV